MATLGLFCVLLLASPGRPEAQSRTFTGCSGTPRTRRSCLYVATESVRFPFIAVGMRYDLNHNKWHGPNTGNYD
jgi:hypothetical protein